jgi:signal peptidase I
MTREVFLTQLSSEPTLAPEEEAPQSSLRHFLLDMLETFGLAVVLFIAINMVSARVRVDGFSMLPTLQNNQYVLVNRMVSHYQRGDIIVFRPPMYPREDFLRRLIGQPTLYEDYIKRVVGLPGETVEVTGGKVLINGIPLDEPYIAQDPTYTGTWEVPQDYLFVLGDNRNNSSDSHSWGFLPIENVLGKAVLVYWPFTDWMILRTPAALAAH